MLTPKDIHEAKFKRVFRGYDVEMVDQFLERVVLEYSQVYEENQRLRTKISELEQQLASYSKLQDSIQDILTTAKLNAKALQESTEKQARSVLESAQLEAAQIQREAEAKLAEQKLALEQLIGKEQVFRSQMETYLYSFLELLRGAEAVVDFDSKKQAAAAADE
jgi:cell division initiation protein